MYCVILGGSKKTGKEVFPISTKEAYTCAVKEINTHWATLWGKNQNALIMDDDFYSHRNPYSYLYYLNEWIEELLKMVIFPSKNRKLWLSLPSCHSVSIPNEQIYRTSVLKYKEELSVELQTLLPAFEEAGIEKFTSQHTMSDDGAEIQDTTYKAVRAILPVLVSGYIQNRRGDAQRGEKSEDPPQFTASTYLNLIYHEDAEGIKAARQRIYRLFEPHCWDKEYSKLKYTQITPQKISKIYFGDVMLFLFLCYKMKDFCNLTLSCTLFEEFAGSVGFFDSHFPRVDDGHTFKNTCSDPKKEAIILYLEKMFDVDIAPDERAGWWNFALNRYVVHVVNEVARREGKKFEESFSDGKWGKNKWVARMISSLPDLSWLQAYCPYGNEMADDSLYQEIKMVKLFQKKSYKRRLEKLISIRYSKKIMCPGGSKHSAKYRIKPVGDMSERDATGKWIREEKEIYRLVNKFTANPKLKKGFYAYYAGIIRLAKSKKPKKPKKYRADEQIISRLKQVKMV